MSDNMNTNDNINDNTNNNINDNSEVYEADDKISRKEIIEIKNMNKTSQARKSMLTTGIVSAILGAILLFWPGLTMGLICQFLGAALAITGIVTIVSFFTQSEGTPFRGMSLAAGIPLAILGLCIFLRPSFLIEFIPIVIGVIILIDGVADLIESVRMLRYGDDRWWVSLIFAALTIILGLVLITRPFGIAKFIMRVIGAVILFNGLTDIFIANRIKNKIKDV